jgi:hypothetical protein
MAKIPKACHPSKGYFLSFAQDPTDLTTELGPLNGISPSGRSLQPCAIHVMGLTPPTSSSTGQFGIGIPSGLGFDICSTARSSERQPIKLSGSLFFSLTLSATCSKCRIKETHAAQVLQKLAKVLRLNSRSSIFSTPKQSFTTLWCRSRRHFRLEQAEGLHKDAHSSPLSSLAWFSTSLRRGCQRPRARRLRAN